MPTPQQIDRQAHDDALAQSLANLIERGTLPWRKPWIDTPHCSGYGRIYDGTSQFILQLHDRSSPDWYTEAHVLRRGATLKANARPAVVQAIFAAKARAGQLEGERTVARTIVVYNRDDIEFAKGNRPRRHVRKHPRYVEARGPQVDELHPILQLVAAVGARVSVHRGRAVYTRSTDAIQIPDRKSFCSEEAYFSTLLHELCHWTGHPARCRRVFGGTFGDLDYAREELVAEFASSLLCAMYGVRPELLQHESYLHSWARHLREGQIDLHKIANDARRAVDWLLTRAKQTATAGAVGMGQLDPGSSIARYLRAAT